ncbi:dephospho-CoA kinase-domain-containing protein [Melampsora americana]|nr:dephospho-CoA kinase-domain-containing protein [Melampsora americana]
MLGKSINLIRILLKTNSILIKLAFHLLLLVIGLTGGIASGKSTVSKILKSNQIPIIDLDLIARQVVQPGSKSLKQIQSHFSHIPNLILSNGQLNRERLGSIIFSNPNERKWLDQTLHPKIRRLMLFQLIKLWLTGHKFCVIDSPLLIETGMWKFCGKIILVYCSEEIQLKRLMLRNQLNESNSKEKIQSQLPLKSKLIYSDYILNNDLDLIHLESNVKDLIFKLNQSHSNLFWILNWFCFPFTFFNGFFTLLFRYYSFKSKLS